MKLVFDHEIDEQEFLDWLDSHEPFELEEEWFLNDQIKQVENE